MLPLYYIGIVQSFFAALLISKKENKSQGDIILIIWLIIIGFEMIYSLLNLTIFEFLPDLIVLPLLYGPFLYFYTHHLISNQKIKYSIWIKHFIPFFAVLLLAIIWQDAQSINSIDYFKKGIKTYLSFFDFFLFIISIFWYWIIVLKLVNKHQKTLSEQLSFHNTKIQLNWVLSIALWILGGFILSSIIYAYFIIKSIFPFNPIVIYHMGLLIFIFSISYYGIHQPPLPQMTGFAGSLNKHKGDFSDADLASFGEQLDNYMKNKKPYLNGDLTLFELAKNMGESEKKISVFLNYNLNKNFFTFINDYRLLEAMNRIKDPHNSNLTLLAIGYDSGFNSKSSFNALFKKHTGLTPSEYQKQHCTKK